MPKNNPVGIYLSEIEKAEIKDLAEKAGYKTHAFLQYGIRWFITEYKKNKRILKTEKKTVLKKPK